MVSNIDPTVPVAGAPTTQSVRDNFQTAHDEISALQVAGPYAPLASPPLTGNPTAPTPAPGDSDTSIATTAFVAGAVAPALNNVGRNLVHNPLFNVQQRGQGPWTANGVFTSDRWGSNLVGGTQSITIIALTDADRAAIGDEAAEFALQAVVAGAAAAADYNQIYHTIEDVRRLGGKTITTSFWAKVASGSHKIGVTPFQFFGTGGSPSNYVQPNGLAVTIGTTWARYSVTQTLPSTSGKTLGTDNNHYTGLQLYFSSGATSNAAAGGIGVQSGTFSVWGVQVEIGNVATPLEKPDPQQDLAKCQRFYQTGGLFSAGYCLASQAFGISATLHVAMRATPNLIYTDGGSGNLTTFTVGSFGAWAVTVYGIATVTGNTQIFGTFTASADL